MSSDNKKTFVTQASSKGAGAEITSDTLAMPDNTEGLVLNVKADSSCSGVVDVNLEMSPDGTNWCPAVSRTQSLVPGGSVTEIVGNEESVKLTPDAGEFKNKHARGGLNFDVSGSVVTPDGSGARDLLDQHVAINKSFNYSQWFKTSENPTTTYKPVLFRHGGHDTFENTKNIKLDDQSGAGTIANTQNSMGLSYQPSTVNGVSSLNPDNSFTIVEWIDLNLLPSSGAVYAGGSYNSTSANRGIYAQHIVRAYADRLYLYFNWRSGPAPFYGSNAYFDVTDYTKALCIIKRNDASAGVGNTGVAHIDVIDSDGTSLYNQQVSYTIPSGYNISGNTWTSQSGVLNTDELAYLNTFVADGNLNTLYETVGSNIKPKDFTSHANLIDWYRFGGSDTKALVTPVNGVFPTLTNSAFTSSDAIPALATTDNLYSLGPSELTQNLVEPKSTYTTVHNYVSAGSGQANIEIIAGSDAATHFGTSGFLSSNNEGNLGKHLHSKFKPDEDFSTSRWLYGRSDYACSHWKGRGSYFDGYSFRPNYTSAGTYTRYHGEPAFFDLVADSVIAGGARSLEVIPVISQMSSSYWYIYDSSPLLTFTHHGSSTTFDVNLNEGFNCVTTYYAPTDPENGIPESAICMYINGNKIKIKVTTESGTDYVEGYAPADNYFKGDETYTHESSTFTDSQLQYGATTEFYRNAINNHLDFTRVLTAAEASKLYNGGKLLDFTDLSTNAAFPISKTGLVRAYDADQKLPHLSGVAGVFAGLKDVSGYGVDIYETAGTQTNIITTGYTRSPALGFMATPSLLLDDVFTSGTGGFSISGWFKTTDTGTLFSNTGGAVTTGMTMEVTSTGTTLTHHDSSLVDPSLTVVNDGNWHHLVFTYTSGSQKTFIDGVEISSTTSSSLTDDDLKGDNGFTLLGDGQENAHAASPGASDASKLSASISNWSVHSEALSADAVKQIYSNGHVRNIKNLPSITEGAIKAWWQLQDPTTPEQDSSGNAVSLVYQDGASATLVSKLATATGEVLAEDVINGNAITMSLTKSFNFTTKKWVSTADQDGAICVSFNGFEEQAEYFALWKCSQTIAGSTIDICDGGWHNVILSYRGNNDLSGDNISEGDSVLFGPGPANSLAYHWGLSFDGQPLTAINDGSGADYIGGLNNLATSTYNATTYNVSFPIYNRHLKYDSGNAEEVYKPHAQFSAGIHEVVGVDNINAFQGYVDETSFHSDCWWIDQAGTSVITNTLNAEKPAALHGNTTALSNRGAGTEYLAGVPYPLNDPAKIGSSRGGNQFINPYRKGETQENAATSIGGLEGWWRWGDTPGDCSITINDVKDHDDSINARDIAAFGIVTADRQLMTSADSIHLADRAAGTASGSIGISFPQVVVAALEVGACNLKQMASPVLKYLRVKFTGAGSCDLGSDSVEAQINFRIKE